MLDDLLTDTASTITMLNAKVREAVTMGKPIPTAPTYKNAAQAHQHAKRLAKQYGCGRVLVKSAGKWRLVKEYE